MRMFTLDPTTFEVLDYEEHGYHVEDANENGAISWRKLYSARDAYNLTDLTPESWLSASYRLIEDKDYFEEFLERYAAGADAGENNDEEARKRIGCVTFCMNEEEFKSCIGSASSSN